MRVNQFFTSTLAAASLLVASCSTQKMATNSADDVYNTTAQARVYKYAPPAQTAQIDTSRYDPNYKNSNPEYDMDYASRIDRFYYGSPNRVYFDDYYNFYGYNSWYNPYDWSLGFNYGWGFNRWMNPFNSWAYYGSPYHWNTWGPYSYWGGGFGWGGGLGWGGGYWGGGGWGGGAIVRNDNYRARPNRGAENGIGVRPNGSVIDRGARTGGNTSIVGRTGSRPESYNPTTTTNGTSSRGTSNSGGRPSRVGNSGDYRPTRTTESSRPSYSPPPQSSSGSSSGRTGGSSGGSSSSGGGGGRPTRGGGR